MDESVFGFMNGENPDVMSCMLSGFQQARSGAVRGFTRDQLFPVLPNIWAPAKTRYTKDAGYFTAATSFIKLLLDSVM